MKWIKDNSGDRWVQFETKNHSIVTGRIVRCPVTLPFGTHYYRTQSRWMLLVSDHFHGFYKTMMSAIEEFEKVIEAGENFDKLFVVQKI